MLSPGQNRGSYGRIRNQTTRNHLFLGQLFKVIQRRIKNKKKGITIPNEKHTHLFYASFLLGIIVYLFPTDPVLLVELETKPRRTARTPIPMKGTYIISNLSDAFPEPIISPRIAA